MGDEVGSLNMQRIEQAGDIAALGFLVVATRRARRETHAAQIRHDDGVIAREIRRQRRPHIAGIGKAMEQDDRRSMTANPYMQDGLVGGNFLNAKFRRKRLHLCHGRQR